MVEVIALIKLYNKGNRVRKTAFANGYRPLFNFIPDMKTTGKITLINRDKFFPGDEGIVKISFLNKDYLGDDFKLGKKFTFDEGGEPLGIGEIIEIMLD